MADIKWIKITTDIFDDEKIKLIDTMPDRDALIVIWFKLLTLTGKKNNSGLLFMSTKMPYTEEMLATIFNRPINTVRMALKFFQDFDMIEIAENKMIAIVNWERHQNIDGMDKIKEQNKLRQRNYREKQKLLSNSNVTSRDNNAIDKDKEEDKEKDKKKINIMFDTFWNLYNKKIGKIKCESKWIELTNDDRENIIKVLPNYVKSTPDVKFRKDPYTYLNNESWNDEIIFKDKDVEIKKSTTKDKYEEIY